MEEQNREELLAELQAARQRINDLELLEQSHLAAIVESSEDAIISKTLDGKITSWNKSAERIFGYRADEIIGRSILTIIPPDLINEEALIISRLKNGERIEFYETKRVRKDGRLIDISLTISPVKNYQGVIVGAAKIARDITEQRRLLEELSQRELLIKFINNAVPVLISYIDKDQRYRFTNAGYERWFNLDEAELIGKHMRDVLGEGAYHAVQSSVELVLAGNEVTFERVVPYRFGGERFVRGNYVPHFDSTGKVTGFAAIVIDLTKEKEAEMKILESEQRFRLMADTAPVLLWLSDQDGKCNFFNKPWLDYTGRAMDQVIGYGWLEDVHPEDKEYCLNAYLSGVKTQQSFNIEYRLRGADGNYRWFFDQGVPRFHSMGQFVGFIGSCIDITERRNTEETRKQLFEREQEARLKAEAASRLKDEFLATISHELRTPLTSILGWLRMLRAGTLDSTTATHALEVIDRNAKSQAQLVEDLLDISRITMGRMRLHVHSIDPAIVIQAAVDAVRLAADAKNIRIQTILDSSANPIAGDPERLQQVIWNLLSNSIKFTPKGGKIQINLERVNSHVEITVRDNGHGIKGDFLPYVFNTFTQADSSSSRMYGGLGMGLSIVKHIVELHGGLVSVESEGEGLGACFTISIPLMAVKNSAKENELETLSSWRNNNFSCPVEIVGLKILIVDDERDTCEMLKTIFEYCSAEVKAVTNIQDALAVIDEWHPSILISDIGMAGETGYDLIRSIRSRDPQAGGKIPAVALTAFARIEDRIKALTAGFQMHVAKPVEPMELLTVVASLASLAS